MKKHSKLIELGAVLVVAAMVSLFGERVTFTEAIFAIGLMLYLGFSHIA